MMSYLIPTYPLVELSLAIEKYHNDQSESEADIDTRVKVRNQVEIDFLEVGNNTKRKTRSED